MADKGILQSEMFYIEHLSPERFREDISDFYIEAPEGQGLSAYINKYPYQKGVGYVIFKKFILPMIYEAGKYIGIKMVYIFALPYDRLMNRYRRYGFRRLSETEENDLHRRLKPRYDESCKFMYLLLT